MKLAKTLSFCALFFCAANIFSQSRPVATSISAKAGRERTIQIKWEFPISTEPKITGAKLYRASKPVSSYKEVEDLTPLANFAGTKYTDRVPKAGEYFYAVIAVTPAGDYKTIIPGMNATVKGVRAMIPASKIKESVQPEEQDFGESAPTQSQTYKESNDITSQEEQQETKSALSTLNTKSSLIPLRNMPLPLPTNILGIEQEPVQVSDQALESVKGLGKQQTKKAVPFKTPYYFEEDMFAADGGDEYILFETLRSGLVPRKYRDSIRLLSEFLSVNRDAAVTKRAEFYLGESYYFCGEYENAIRCFLAVQEEHTELAKKWIDSSLDLMSTEY